MHYETVRRAIPLLKAAATYRRLMILEMLRPGPLQVSELTTRADCGQSVMSTQLRILKTAGLVESNRDGRMIRYALTPIGAVIAGKVPEILIK